MKPILVFVLLVILTSCTINHRTSPGRKAHNPEVKPLPTTIQQAMSRTKLECQGTCNESVGFLVGFEYDESGDRQNYVCTASLIGPDLVLTNAHCIPQSFHVQPNEPCGKDIGVRFAASGSHSVETFYCSQILKISSSDNTEEDYAVFRLNRKTKRHYFSIEREFGFNTEETYTINKINPIKDDKIIRGRMEEVNNCYPVMGTIMAPGFLDPYATAVTLFGCTPVAGNSGSAVLNKDNKVVGVLYAGASENAVEVFREAQMGEVRTDISLINNFTCVDWTGFGRVPETCKTLSKRVEKRNAENLKKFLETDEAFRTKILNRTGPELENFRYEVEAKPSDGPSGFGELFVDFVWTFDLTCVEPQADFLRSQTLLRGGQATYRRVLDEYWRQSLEPYSYALDEREVRIHRQAQTDPPSLVALDSNETWQSKWCSSPGLF